jgi:heme exporter protein C
MSISAGITVTVHNWKRTKINWFRYSSPQTFFPLAAKLAPWFGAAAVLLCLAGLYIGFFVAPTDAQQGDAYRIIFIHVPAAWMSMFLYVVMAFWAGAGLVFNTRLSGMMASAIAPSGAIMTFVALWTGALWGRPTWGTWWVWDARLTSELILLFLYFGFMALQAAIDDPRRADKAGAVLALTGVVNIPIIYFSVQWWNTLHQGASVSLKSAPTMAATMFAGMIVMSLGFWMYSIAATLLRVRRIILERERRSDWVAHYVRTLK